MSKSFFKSLAALFLFLFLGTSQASACVFNISVRNTGTKLLYFFNAPDSEYTAVKTKGGFWRALWNGGWIDELNSKYFYLEADEYTYGYYDATLSCLHERRYKLTYRCESGQYHNQVFTQYYPSENGWTKNKHINFELNKCN